jgi:hypothetical protein
MTADYGDRGNDSWLTADYGDRGNDSWLWQSMQIVDEMKNRFCRGYRWYTLFLIYKEMFNEQKSAGIFKQDNMYCVRVITIYIRVKGTKYYWATRTTQKAQSSSPFYDISLTC